MADIANLQIKVDTNQVKTANKDLDSLSRSSKNADSSSKQLTTSFLSMRTALAGLGIATTAVQLGKIADSYTKLTSQLKLATKNQSEFNQAYANVQRIAQTAQSSIEETAILYSRLSTSLRDMNATQKQVSNITEAVSLGLKISGASAAEASSAMLQLSQAFSSGVLRGEEFNAVNESAPRIMQALAESLGVTRGELRGMAQDGKLTSDIVGNALLKSIEQFRKEAQQTQNISGGFQAITNEFTLLVGEIDKATGASSLLTQALAGIAEGIKGLRTGEGGWLENVIKGLPVVGSIYGAYDMVAPDRAAKGNSASGTIRRAGTTGQSDGLLKPPSLKPVVDTEDAKRKLKELTDLRKKAAEEANQLELKRLNVAIWTNEQIYKLEQEKIKERDASTQKILEIEQQRANENFEEAQRMSKATTDEWKSAFEDLKNAVDGYSRDMSRSLAQFALGGKVSFADMIDSMLLKLLEFANQKLIFDPLFKAISGQIDTSGGGGFFGNLASGITNFFTGGVGANAGAYSIDQNPYLNFAGTRAAGGNVSAGSSYLVGERGAEMFVPSQNGSIIPNNGKGNTNIVVNVIEAQGTKANVQQQQNPDGTMSISVIIEQLYGVMNRDLQRGTGIAPTMERRYGLNRVAGAY